MIDQTLAVDIKTFSDMLEFRNCSASSKPTLVSLGEFKSGIKLSLQTSAVTTDSLE